jgi:hypothetical protein
MQGSEVIKDREQDTNLPDVIEIPLVNLAEPLVVVVGLAEAPDTHYYYG